MHLANQSDTCARRSYLVLAQRLPAQTSANPRQMPQVAVGALTALSTAWRPANAASHLQLASRLV